MAEMTPAEMRGMIEAAPFPMSGPPIHKRPVADGYELAGNACARALLIVAEERPELLDLAAERREDPTGWAAANNRKLWAAAKEKWPELDDWLGGITGFQFGWAHNTVRYILGVEPTGNPAIGSIG